MAPALQPGDWLLLDPTSGRWPRRGSIVVFREPGTGSWPSSAWRPAPAIGSASRPGCCTSARTKPGCSATTAPSRSTRAATAPFRARRWWAAPGSATARCAGSAACVEGPPGRQTRPMSSPGRQFDHGVVARQHVLEHDPLDAGRRETGDHRPGLIGRAGDPARPARLEPALRVRAGGPDHRHLIPSTRRPTSTSSAPKSTPAITERRIVAGSRPIFRHSSSSREKTPPQPIRARARHVVLVGVASGQAE